MRLHHQRERGVFFLFFVSTPLLFFSPCACARVAQDMTNDHRSSHRYTQEFKPRRTRVNLGAAERLSTLLWTPEADKWTNFGSENELFASRWCRLKSTKRYVLDTFWTRFGYFLDTFWLQLSRLATQSCENLCAQSTEIPFFSTTIRNIRLQNESCISFWLPSLLALYMNHVFCAHFNLMLH